MVKKKMNLRALTTKPDENIGFYGRQSIYNRHITETIADVRNSETLADAATAGRMVWYLPGQCKVLVEY